jgi:hypothetical protein
MPHHWKPFDPGNPDCAKIAQELLEQYGDRLKYVGSDQDKCWALIESAGEEEPGFRDEDPLEQCEKRKLTDWYVKGRRPEAAS